MYKRLSMFYLTTFYFFWEKEYQKWIKHADKSANERIRGWILLSVCIFLMYSTS